MFKVFREAFSKVKQHFTHLLPPTFRGWLKRILGDPDWFLFYCRSIIHVGANDGHERELYNRRHLRVVWVEALPDVFRLLSSNISRYPDQSALNALVTDREGELYTFNITNNSALSSSIYELADHRAVWPEVTVTRKIQLRSTTLKTLLEEHGYHPKDFDALVLDVQGAELLAVKGAGAYLSSFRFIKAEASDFELYHGACTCATLTKYMTEAGFTVRHMARFAEKSGIGSCYDILYERKK